MTETIDAPSMLERYGRALSFDAAPTALIWLGTTACVALGDGSVRIVREGDDARCVAVHAGAILTACRHPDGESILTGGDDGRVCRVADNGEVREIGRFERKWVEHLVASAVSGIVAASVGKEVAVWGRGAGAPSHRFAVPSTVGGLALDAKGKRLAVSHYGGASLFYAAGAASEPTRLDWGGSHLACTLSPDGRYLVTALQETGLHAWRLPEKKDLRMSGYAAKTRSFSWDRRANWLATGGDRQAIVWPFAGKSGPMGQAPLLLGEAGEAIVTQVAFHPVQEVLAVGFDDGTVLLARPADGGTMAIDDPGDAVTTLAWNAAGTRLGWGCENGRIGLLDMEAEA